MLWHGRPNGFGLWLPEVKKANICGMEGKNVVAYGRLPFSTHRDGHVLYLKDFGSFSTKKLRYLIPSNVRAKMLHNF